jgi:hypothetical protein
MTKKRNVGILAGISWNSKKWQDFASQEDYRNSNHRWAREHSWQHEDLNFGHLKFNAEDDGFYIGYTSVFKRLPRYANEVEIVFLKSRDYKLKKQFIIGIYGLPIIRDFNRYAMPNKFKGFNSGNFASLPENITLLDSPLEINNEICSAAGFLPEGKQIGNQGFNYLQIENVQSILSALSKLNPENEVIKKFKEYFLADNKFKNPKLS